MKWAKKSAALNQWVKKEDFNDLGPIIKFNKTTRKSSKETENLAEKLWKDLSRNDVAIDQSKMTDDALVVTEKRWSSRLNRGRRG